MIFRGKVHKYGADVNTDVIIPARYLNTSDTAELAKHCMEDEDAEFLNRVKPGDIMVATTNFGCGSSREHAPISLKAAGISCIVASSFARIFFRNSINLALPVLECPEAAQDAEMGDDMEVDVTQGTVRNLTKGKTYQSKPYPEFMMELIQAGGLIEYTKRQLQARGGLAIL